MSDRHTFTGGEHVRLKPTPQSKYPDIGIVVGTEGENIVMVEYRDRLGSKRVTKPQRGDKLEEMCKETVYRAGWSRSSECGRKAKEDHLCGMHLAHRERRKREREELDRREAASKAKRARMIAVGELAQAEIDALFGGSREIEISVTKITERARVSMDLDTFLDIIRNA